MAMVDGGFPMKCLVCAVTCCLTEFGEIHLDPTLEQEKVPIKAIGLYKKSKHNHKQQLHLHLHNSKLLISVFYFNKKNVYDWNT